MGYDAQYRLATTVLIQQTECTCSTLSWQELSCSVIEVLVLKVQDQSVCPYSAHAFCARHIHIQKKP